MKTKLIIYRDKKKDFRWRMKRNGRIVAEGGEGYCRLPALRRTLVSLLRDMIFNDHPSIVIEDAVEDAQYRNFKP